MLGEERMSIININLKKYQRQIQHPVIDLKMVLLVKTVNDPKLFAKKHHFRCVTGSDFASDYNKSNTFYEQQLLYHGFLEQ